MNEKKCIPKADTFIVDVRFRENSTWQGSVTYNNDNQSANFRSTLELIKIIDSALCENHPEEEE